MNVGDTINATMVVTVDIGLVTDFDEETEEVTEVNQVLNIGSSISFYVLDKIDDRVSVQFPNGNICQNFCPTWVKVI
tara:strand:- start:1022 stop:1252 length:231 start_codon:yes stop_codon:yes gene_type:complete